MPTIKATCKKDKITLPKAVAIINNCGSILLVQKARRALKHAKKRAAIEVKVKEGARGEIREGAKGEIGAGAGGKIGEEEARGKIGEEDNSKVPRACAKAGGRAAKRVKFSRGTKRSK